MEIEVCTSYEGFLALDEGWRRLVEQESRPGFYSSFEWYKALFVCGEKPVGGLRIICVYDSGELVGILPMSLGTRKLRFFRYRSLELLGNIYSPVRGGLFRKDWERIVAVAIARYLQNSMSREWDILYFDDIYSRDPFYHAFKGCFGQDKGKSITTEQFSNVVTDLCRYEDSVSFHSSLSKNLRRLLTKSFNKINKYGRAIVALYASDRLAVQTAMDSYREIYEESWKGVETDPGFHNKLAHYLAGLGFLRLFVLYYKRNAEGILGEAVEPDLSCDSMVPVDPSIPQGYEPIGAYYAVVFGTRVYGLKTVYKASFSSFSPGSVLMWFMLKHILDVDGCISLDHQKGDELFKYKFKGELNDISQSYKRVNPICFKGRIEFLFEMKICPFLKKVRGYFQSRVKK